MAIYDHVTKTVSFSDSEILALAHRYENPQEAIQQWLDSGMLPLLESVKKDAVAFAEEKGLQINFAVADHAQVQMFSHPLYENGAVRAEKRRNPQ